MRPPRYVFRRKVLRLKCDQGRNEYPYLPSLALLARLIIKFEWNRMSIVMSIVKQIVDCLAIGKITRRSQYQSPAPKSL